MADSAVDKDADVRELGHKFADLKLEGRKRNDKHQRKLDDYMFSKNMAAERFTLGKTGLDAALDKLVPAIEHRLAEIGKYARLYDHVLARL